MSHDDDLNENQDQRHENHQSEEHAAVVLQKFARGKSARKRTLELQIDKFNREEAERMDQQRRQVEEGEILLES